VPSKPSLVDWVKGHNSNGAAPLREAPGSFTPGVVEMEEADHSRMDRGVRLLWYCLYRRELERILPWGALHADPAEFGELFKGGLAPEPPPTTILYATEGYLRFIMDGLIVDMDHP